MDFFGLGEYSNGEFHFIREPSGAWSWQHLTFVSFLIVSMIARLQSGSDFDKSTKESNPKIECSFGAHF